MAMRSQASRIMTALLWGSLAIAPALAQQDGGKAAETQPCRTQPPEPVTEDKLLGDWTGADYSVPGESSDSS
jgi:hypothetical protein